MRLTVLGSAGTYPVRGRPGSGYLIEHRETRIWCDAGPGTLTELPVPVSELDAVFVSHRHPDHCLDVVIASHVLAYGPDPRFGVPLYGPSSALEAIVGFVDGGRIDEVFDVTPLEDGDRVTIGSLILSVAVTDHSVDTLASGWETDHRSLCYSGDTGPEGTGCGSPKTSTCSSVRRATRVSRESTNTAPPHRLRSGAIARSAEPRNSCSPTSPAPRPGPVGDGGGEDLRPPGQLGGAGCVDHAEAHAGGVIAVSTCSR